MLCTTRVMRATDSSDNSCCSFLAKMGHSFHLRVSSPSISAYETTVARDSAERMVNSGEPAQAGCLRFFRGWRGNETAIRLGSSRIFVGWLWLQQRLAANRHA